jgi:hypothetical protein
MLNSTRRPTTISAGELSTPVPIIIRGYLRVTNGEMSVRHSRNQLRTGVSEEEVGDGMLQSIRRDLIP